MSRRKTGPKPAEKVAKDVTAPAEKPGISLEPGQPTAEQIAALNEATTARVRAKLAEKKQQQQAEEELIKLSTDGACEILTTRLYRGLRLWVTEPSLKQGRLLRQEVGDVLEQADRIARIDLTTASPEQVEELGETTHSLDARLLRLLCPFICRYDEAGAALRPLTFEEAEEALGPRSVRELFRLLIGTESQDPN